MLKAARKEVEKSAKSAEVRKPHWAMSWVHGFRNTLHVWTGTDVTSLAGDIYILMIENTEKPSATMKHNETAVCKASPCPIGGERCSPMLASDVLYEVAAKVRQAQLLAELRHSHSQAVRDFNHQHVGVSILIYIYLVYCFIYEILVLSTMPGTKTPSKSSEES